MHLDAVTVARVYFFVQKGNMESLYDDYGSKRADETVNVNVRSITVSYDRVCGP